MFYPQLEKLCQERHIKPSALARKLGFSPSAPGRWKAGAIPQADTLQRLAEYFDVSTDFLLYGGERRRNAVHDIHHSAVVQDNLGSVVSVENRNGGGGDGLEGMEAELLKVFRSLDMRDKIKLLQASYELESNKGR